MIKLNVGCGWRDFGKEWTHIDGGDYPHLEHSDIFLKDYSIDSVDLIYASHLLEYFDEEEVESLLWYWKRALKKDGVLRIAVPDFESMANLYVNENYPLTSFLGPLYGRMHMGEEYIYHKRTYDFDTLSGLLNTVGFHDIKRYDWRDTEHSEIDDHSQAYLPHMDKQNGTLISLNIEAKKL